MQERADTQVILTAIIAVVVVLAAATYLRAIVVPILFALAVIALALPLQERLDRHMPLGLATTLTFIAVLLVLSAFAYALYWTLDAAAVSLSGYRQQLTALFESARNLAGSYGLRLPRNPLDSVTPQQIAGQAWAWLGGVWGFLGAFGITLAIVALGLPAVPRTRRNVRQLGPEVRERTVSRSHEIASAIRSYTLWTGVTCALNGLLTWGSLALLGLDFAILWGAIAFILTVVPTIGAVLSIVPPALMALIQFDGWTMPLAVLGAMVAVQLVMGNFVEPSLKGRSVKLLPVVTLLSFLFWSSLFGPAGALLGIPLTAAVIIIARAYDSTRWIAVLLTRPDAPSTPEEARSVGG